MRLLILAKDKKHYEEDSFEYDRYHENVELLEDLSSLHLHISVELAHGGQQAPPHYYRIDNTLETIC